MRIEIGMSTVGKLNRDQRYKLKKEDGVRLSLFSRIGDGLELIDK